MSKYISIPDSLFVRRDLTIEQKWLYVVLLYKSVTESDPLVTSASVLSRDPNVMCPSAFIEQNLAILARRQLLAYTVDKGVYKITVGSVQERYVGEMEG